MEKRGVRGPEMQERKGYAGPGPNTKGGEYHGGPKRWTGSGPAPARHVPWPEIFKHHISLIEGHLKMVDMVRKHTVEGTGNHRTIMGCVNRSRDMLQEAKHISRSFVPPPKHREQVPLGSSSASMYPGYSPADHEYGEAAEEYGRAAAEARAKGIEIKPKDVDYEIGQAKGVKRKTLVAIHDAKTARESGSGSGTGSGSDVAATSSSAKPTGPRMEPSQAKSSEPPAEGDNPYFVIDTKPTPVNLSGMPQLPTKRSVSPPPEPVEGKKPKKAKKSHEGDMPKKEEKVNGVKFEDISEEVDERLKEKEEKRKRKEEKKRKRESEGEPAASSITAPGAGEVAADVEVPNKKKKVRHDPKQEPTDETTSKKRSGEENVRSDEGEGHEKKKRKKHKNTASTTT